MAAVAVLAAAGWMFVIAANAVGRATLRWWPLVLAGLAAAGFHGVWRIRRAVRTRRLAAQMAARLRITLSEFDAMDDRQFENALTQLLIRDGWRARRVGQAGDQGADIIADHARLGRLVVQAKHTTVRAKVGSAVMYQVKGTAGPVHHARTAVVVTNGHLTRDARTWGERHDIHWIDRDRLHQWAGEGLPLHYLLRIPARRTRNPMPSS
ncbi:restriction endonuclease [Streptomyces sp. NPDC052012]|uniref:restriction endonuclease n=1 Tax=Streptomyces sp. NPDC052012 TaxID=3155051 RepID=UPI00344B074A